MLHAPTRFEERLALLFDNRLRVRWSNKRNQWHIEFKVARANSPKRYISTEDDAGIRARDGYAFLMEVTRGTKAPCPKCGLDLDVPVFELREVVCPSCRVRGFDARYPMCYFPLDGDMLMQKLISLDPLRTYRDGSAKRADAVNAAVEAAALRKFKNHIEAATKDHYREIAGIPFVGYTGKHFKG